VQRSGGRFEGTGNETDECLLSREVEAASSVPKRKRRKKFPSTTFVARAAVRECSSRRGEQVTDRNRVTAVNAR